MIDKNLTSSLNTKITIKENIKTSDGGGGFQTSWHDLKNIFAKIEYQNFNEYTVGGIKFCEQNIKLTTRIDKSITKENKISINNEIYIIKSINYYQKNYMEIFCIISL